MAICQLQPRPLRPLPRDLQHPDPAGAGDPPGDGARRPQGGRRLPVRSVGRVPVDQRDQARGLPVRSQWWGVRSDHGTPGDGDHEPQGDVPPLGQGRRGQSHRGHGRLCLHLPDGR